MKTVLELCGAVGLAFAVHLALLMRFEPADGGESGGQGGQSMVTVAAANAAVETMVEHWERPPETTQAVVVPAVTGEPQPRPNLTAALPDLPDAPMAVISLPSRSATSPTSPEVTLTQPTPQVPDTQPIKPQMQSASLAPARPATPQTARPLAPTLQPLTPDPIEAALPDPTPADPPQRKFDDLGRLIVSPRPPALPDGLEPSQIPAQTSNAPRPAKTTPTARVAPSSAAQQAQVSAGTGGSNQGGTTQSAQVKTISKGEAVRLERVWGGKIQRKIRRFQRVPRGANGSGIVTITLTVATDGRVVSAGIRKSSGVAVYDQAAIAAIRRAGRLPAAPRELPPRKYVFAFLMEFSS